MFLTLAPVTSYGRRRLPNSTYLIPTSTEMLTFSLLEHLKFSSSESFGMPKCGKKHNAETFNITEKCMIQQTRRR